VRAGYENRAPLRSLSPVFDGRSEGREMAGLPYPEWYYGGPFARVTNPDSDLPRREEAPIPESQRKRTEMHAISSGERIIAPFHDGNTIEDVLMELRSGIGYPTGWSEEDRFVYPTVQGLLARVRDRLVEKSARSRSRKGAWLTEAISFVDRARQAFSRSDYESGNAALRQAEDLVAGAGGAAKPKRIIQLGPGSSSGG
jgi:hypothetical protein